MDEITRFSWPDAETLTPLVAETDAEPLLPLHSDDDYLRHGFVIG